MRVEFGRHVGKMVLDCHAGDVGRWPCAVFTPDPSVASLSHSTVRICGSPSQTVGDWGRDVALFACGIVPGEGLGDSYASTESVMIQACCLLLSEPPAGHNQCC